MKQLAKLLVLMMVLHMNLSMKNMIRLQRVFLSASRSGPLPEFNGMITVRFNDPRNESRQLKNEYRASYDLTSSYSFVPKPDATTEGVQKTFLFNHDKFKYSCDRSDTCSYQTKQNYVQCFPLSGFIVHGYVMICGEVIRDYIEYDGIKVMNDFVSADNIWRRAEMSSDLIIGIGNSKRSFIYELYKAGRITQPKFTFYFKSQGKDKFNQAILALGDSFKFQQPHKLFKFPVFKSDAMWNIRLRVIQLGNTDISKDVVAKDSIMTFDSTLDFLALPQKQQLHMKQHLQKYLKIGNKVFKMNVRQYLFNVKCNPLQCRALRKKLPVMGFKFGDKSNHVFNIHPILYTRIMKGYLLFRIYYGGYYNSYTLGFSFIIQYPMVFDINKQTVSIYDGDRSKSEKEFSKMYGKKLPI